MNYKKALASGLATVLTILGTNYAIAKPQIRYNSKDFHDTDNGQIEFTAKNINPKTKLTRADLYDSSSLKHKIGTAKIEGNILKVSFDRKYKNPWLKALDDAKKNNKSVYQLKVPRKIPTPTPTFEILFTPTIAQQNTVVPTYIPTAAAQVTPVPTKTYLPTIVPTPEKTPEVPAKVSKLEKIVTPTANQKESKAEGNYENNIKISYQSGSSKSSMTRDDGVLVESNSSSSGTDFALGSRNLIPVLGNGLVGLDANYGAASVTSKTTGLDDITINASTYNASVLTGVQISNVTPWIGVGVNGQSTNAKDYNESLSGILLKAGVDFQNNGSRPQRLEFDYSKLDGKGTFQYTDYQGNIQHLENPLSQNSIDILARLVLPYGIELNGGMNNTHGVDFNITTYTGGIFCPIWNEIGLEAIASASDGTAVLGSKISGTNYEIGLTANDPLNAIVNALTKK